MSTTSIVIAIGNSDNKLTQAQWSLYWDSVDAAVCHYEQFAGFTVHGRWVSPSTAPYQNAAWAIEVEDAMLPHTRDLKNDVRAILPVFGQDSVAWTIGETKLIPAAQPKDPNHPNDICRACRQPVHWVEAQASTGGWWSHVIYPIDGHEADRIRRAVAE